MPERSQRDPLSRAPVDRAVSSGREQPRSPPSGLGGKLLRWCAYTLAGVVLLGAAALGGLRFLLPELGHYRPEIEGWLSRAVGRQIEIGTVDAHWRGWTPVFRFEDVRLAGGTATDGTRTDPSIEFASLTFSIDPLASFRSRTLQPREIAVSGMSLVIRRRSDGTYSVAQLGELTATGPQEGGLLPPWMPSQTRLSLLGSSVLLIDEQRGLRTVSLTGVTLRLERGSDRHRVFGSFELPRDGRVDFAIEGAGDSLTPSWTGAIYIAARDVDLDHLDLDARWLGAERLSGIVSGEVWSTWNSARVLEAEGTIRVQSPGVKDGQRWRGFDEASASFKVERAAEGWTLDARDLVIVTPNGTWPESGIGARWTPPRDGRGGAVVVRAEYARIEDLVALASTGGEPLASGVVRSLIQVAPSGVIEELHVSVPLADRVELEHARVRGQFTGLRLGTEDGSVSVNAANGQFEASEQGVAAEIATGRLHVNAPDWFVHPLRGEKLAGTVAAIPTTDGIRVRMDGASLVTPAGTITAQGWILAPSDETGPELDIALSLSASHIAAVRDLIAGRVLPEPVSRWLDSAMPFGDIRRARLTFHGYLSERPLRDGTGQLEATAELAVPVFSYARNWPEITDASAVVHFDGRRFEARVESGRILKSTIREASVTIEAVDAEVPVVRIGGRIEGASANAMRFLAESPLQARFAPMIDTTAIHGDSTIDLELAVPLKGSDRTITVDGRITFDHNRIDFPRLHSGLTAVNGMIAFWRSAVESDGITATWLGEPIHAVIRTSPETPGAIRLSIDGRLTHDLLGAYLHDAGHLETPTPADSSLLARIRGDTAWNATLDLPPAGSGTPAKLRIASDLTGLRLDLPPPFGKAEGTARMLTVDSRIMPGVERITDFHYDDSASAVLRFTRDAERFRLERGAIRIGDGDAVLPDTPGVTVYGGVPELDTGAWRALLDDVAAIRSTSSDTPRLEPVREVSIDAGSMTALGREFLDTRILATRGADGDWRLDLAGRDMEGTVHLPRDPRTEPVTMDFERVTLELGSAGAGNRSSSLNPRTLPPLSFSARRLVLGDYDLGQVSLATTPSEDGLEIVQLDVRADSFEAEVTGSWSLAGAEHRTEFAMRMHDVDLGRTLESMGFDGNTVAGGATNISLRGEWTGAPADFALDRLTGVMHFLSTDGRLTRIERGVTGRVFGLLTITSLPRRLTLDFRDLFKDGFEYDRIDGSFAIEKGNAHTDDLFMESDTARFEVVGRTGLASRDYDQLVTVIPKISSSVPLIPIWLAQTLLDRNVFDEAFAYQYSITGPWDAPAVERLRTEPRNDTHQQ